jgi:hypothetical protein
MNSMPDNKNVLKHVHPPNPTCFQQVSFTSRRIHSAAIWWQRDHRMNSMPDNKNVLKHVHPIPSNLFPTGFPYQPPNEFGGDLVALIWSLSPQTPPNPCPDSGQGQTKVARRSGNSSGNQGTALGLKQCCSRLESILFST